MEAEIDAGCSVGAAATTAVSVLADEPPPQAPMSSASAHRDNTPAARRRGRAAGLGIEMEMGLTNKAWLRSGSTTSSSGKPPANATGAARLS